MPLMWYWQRVSLQLFAIPKDLNARVEGAVNMHLLIRKLSQQIRLKSNVRDLTGEVKVRFLLLDNSIDFEDYFFRNAS